jgi:O-antigen ligase
MLPLRSIGFLAFFFGMCGVSLVIPALGLANYMLIYQIYPEHTWWHVPLEPLGIRWSMTAALFMMAGLVLALPRLPKVHPAMSLWDLCALGMMVVVAVSEFTGLGPSRDSPALVAKFLKMMLFVFCMTRITTTRQNFNIVIWALVLGSIYIGYDAWTAPSGAFARGRLDKIGGPDFHHSSGLAAHMAMVLPLLAAGFMTCRSWTLRVLPAVAGVLTVNTIILARTRSAFVGLACGALAAVVFAPKRRRLITLAALVIALIGANYLTDDAYWRRMATLQDRDTLLEDPAAGLRVEIWRNASEIIRDHPLGIGIGNFVPTIAEMDRQLGRRAAHNTFLLCWAELGMQGGLLFLTLYLISITQTWQCLHRSGETDDPVWTRYMAYGLFVSLIICAATQMFTERLYTEAFWWILALPGCLKRVVIRESERGFAENESKAFDLDKWIANNPLLPARNAPGAFA